MPIDMNPLFLALTNAFPVGRVFALSEAAFVFAFELDATKTTLDGFADTLRDCPDGVQLVSEGAAYRFE